LIEKIKAETDQTIETVRDFARGIYPPLLEAEGLGAALTAQTARMPIPVSVGVNGLGRYSKEQEATVYFCVLEALQNAMKHSEAGLVEVTLFERDGGVQFEVRDNGVGFDRADKGGTGLLNLADRLDAVGGRIAVESTPGMGTTVSGFLPVPVGARP
jgi:signal transduction histidine kinase